MTKEEAIDNLESFSGLLIYASRKDEFDNNVVTFHFANGFMDVIQMAEEALEKQTPKKPKLFMGNPCCPCCGNRLNWCFGDDDNGVGYYDEYCWVCGQYTIYTLE